MDPAVELAVNEKLDKEREKSDKNYASWTRFLPVEKIVYTAIGIALLAVATKIMSSVIQK